jgi:trimethyllysine dioxygenase
MRIQSTQQSGGRVYLTWKNGDAADFSLFWLRDHCQHPTSLDPSTMQRNVETFSLPSVPEVTEIKTSDDGMELILKWKSEELISTFTSKFLHQFGVPAPITPDYDLWSSKLGGNIPDFEYDAMIKDDDALLKMLEAIQRKGIVTFSNMPSDIEATRALLTRVGYIRDSVFGSLWDFSSNQEHSDSAYTSDSIGLHTDSTYCVDPPGMQLLHCLAFDGEGAFNQFADGFMAAQVIRRENPEAYECLKSVIVSSHYIEPGIHLCAEHPVVTEDADGYFKQICFNNYDRSPFKLDKDKEALFYQAYGRFFELVNDPAYQVQLQLRPGRAVWFDNWRVLHSRTAFSGFRHLAGGYTNKEDFMSKLITLRGQKLWLQN